MRKGIALIELIFAMVIIAITLTAIPDLINQTSKASKEAITQEAIGSATSQLDIILSTFWDENVTDPQNNYPILKVEINATNANQLLQENNFSLRRIGSAKETNRKFSSTMAGDRLTATAKANFGITFDGDSIPDDVDDFDDRNITLMYVEDANVTDGDYKDRNITMNIKVNYIDETPSGGTFNQNSITFDNNLTSFSNNDTTNIKAIELTLTSSNDDKKIVLKAFSCNIGTGKLSERSF